MSKEPKISTVGIVGATGVTAGELIRILLYHPYVKISFLTSTSMQGQAVSEVHKDLLGETSLAFQEIIEPADVIFLCLPHGESRKWMAENKQHIEKGTRIIDLGNDFRVDELWDESKFVYGLCEFNQDQIASATHIANPGCFATAIQLGLLPLAKFEQIESVSCVGITGSTGAGRSLVHTTNANWRTSNISPYKTFSHQHNEEILKQVSQVQENPMDFQFVPWRGAFTRGIFVTLMMKTQKPANEVLEAYKYAYKYSDFVHVSPGPIDLKQVVNTNKALIYLEQVEKDLAVHVAIDNLIKGASGQAVQNMNLMLGLAPTCGLQLKASVY